MASSTMPFAKFPPKYVGTLTAATNANDLEDGFYYIGGDLPVNGPTGATWSFLYCISVGSLKQQYIFKPVSGIWMREYSGNPAAWQQWKHVWVET